MFKNIKNIFQRRKSKKMSTEITKDETNNPIYYAECKKALDRPESVDYLASRGISLATAKQFGCGFDLATKCIIVPSNERSYIARSRPVSQTVKRCSPTIRCRFSS